MHPAPAILQSQPAFGRALCYVLQRADSDWQPASQRSASMVLSSLHGQEHPACLQQPLRYASMPAQSFDGLAGELAR